MIGRLVIFLVPLSALLLGLAGAESSASTNLIGQESWKIRDLGLLGGTESRAVALNERGQIAGDSTTGGSRNPRHAFLWQNGKTVDLGTVGRDAGGDMPNRSEAVAVNDLGQVVGNGSVDRNSPASWAFVWEKGRLTALTARGLTEGGRWVYSRATAINERGQVVGWRGTDLGYRKGRAFLWQGGTSTALGALPGRVHSWAHDVNEHGQIVGESYSVDDAAEGIQVRTRAFLWRGGRMVDLGVLRGTTQSSAIAINERGQVLGSSFRSDDDSVGRAFLWRDGRVTNLGELRPIALNNRGQVIANTGWGEGRAILWQNGKRIDLGTLGGKYSEAVAINERGEIVGSSETKSGVWHAFVWHNGRMVDLGALAGKRSSAVAINARGWIVGSSTTRSGSHAVLWKPESR